MAKATNGHNVQTLADLTPDPHNARLHNPRNVGMIETALGEVGAARSIVIDEDGVVLAGNATIEAAARAGIERVQVVDADGETIIAVRRSGLTPAQKTALALYDNRAAELATGWDADVLAAIAEAGEVDLSGLWRDEELAEVLAGLDTSSDDKQLDTAPVLGDLDYRIMVFCGGEVDQRDTLARLESEGLTCQALIL